MIYVKLFWRALSGGRGFFAIQRPDAQFLVGAIRDQLGLQVALGEMS